MNTTMWAVELPSGDKMHIGTFIECIEMAARFNDRRMTPDHKPAIVVPHERIT